jgi:hypothetical protein
MKSYETVSEAVNDLVKRGYTTDFNLHEEGECIICSSSNQTLSPEEFEIDEVHRFEGMTDPGDEMIVYAISSKKTALKGVLINAYGMYANAQTSKLIKHLQTHL